MMHGIALINCIPIIGIDLWEHAYFNQQYEGDKARYVDAFFAHVDWARASHYFETHNLAGKVAPLLPE